MTQIIEPDTGIRIVVPSCADDRNVAYKLLYRSDAQNIIIDFSANKKCSISFIQQLVRQHITLKHDTTLTFENVDEIVVSYVDWLYASFPEVRSRIIV